MYLTWEYQKYIKQLLIDIWGEIDSTTIIGDFNTPLISMDRSSRQKSTKKYWLKWSIILDVPNWYGFPTGAVVICLPVQETQVWFLGLEDALEEEMATYSSILAWIIPWTEEPGGLQSMGLQRVGHDWAIDNIYKLFHTNAAASQVCKDHSQG